MHRIRIIPIFVLPLAALLLVSCGWDSSSDGDVRVIEVWQGFNPEETPVFREIMSDFEKHWEQRTGEKIRVQISYVSFNDMFAKIKTAALAKITPDITFVDSIKVTDLAFHQALVPIDELDGFKKRYATIDEARQEFVSASFDAGVVNRMGENHLYGLPVQTTTVALFWNRAMFRQKAKQLEEAGLDPSRAPRDWDELLAYSAVLTDAPNGIFGYGMHRWLWFHFPIFNMYGVEFIEYDEHGRGHAAMDTPNTRAAFGRMRTIAMSGVEGGAWKQSALQPDPGFLNEKYAMVLTGPWNVENFTNAGLDFDIALIPGPTQEEIERLELEPIAPELKDELGPQAWTSSNVGGQTGAIMRLSEHPELAYELLEYFTSEKIQRRWASQLGQIPTRLAAWEELDTSKYPFLPKFMTQLRTAERIPQIPLYGILESNIFNPEVDLLLSNPNYPIDTMIEKMEAGLQREILSKINESIDRQID